MAGMHLNRILGRRRICTRWIAQLGLIDNVQIRVFPGGEGIFAPPVTYLRISVEKCVTSALENLTFLSYKFRKRRYTSYPIKLYRFPEKIKFVGNTKIS